MRRIWSGMMRLTSRIARTDSGAFIRLILYTQALQEGWRCGYSAGRRTEMRAIILMIISLKN
jgi:hypothetical protein